MSVWLPSVATRFENMFARCPVKRCCGVHVLCCVYVCVSHLGKASKQYVFRVSGKATLSPDMRGEWRMTAAHS